MVTDADPKPRLDVRVTLVDSGAGAGMKLAVEDLEQIADDLRIVAAAKLFEQQRLSLGKAAELCGLSVARFMEQLAALHIPVINYPPDQLQHDLADW